MNIFYIFLLHTTLTQHWSVSSVLWFIQWQLQTMDRHNEYCMDSLGSLSNDGGDGSENGKKAMGLDWQNNNFARASRFFVHFFSVLHDYNVKVPTFTFCRERGHKTTTFFSFSELSYSLLEFNSRKICQHLTNWASWNERTVMAVP